MYVDVAQVKIYYSITFNPIGTCCSKVNEHVRNEFGRIP